MINKKYYKGKDLYSDGEVENFILECAEAGMSLDDIPESRLSWPVFYHLSPIRANILNWYPFEKESSLLEIGAGCGAVTETLCEKLGSVTAVELSLRRAEIIEARCRQYKNLTIYAGNLNDMDFKKKFDYITLIGVLEYAPAFTDAPESGIVFLKKIRSLLKKKGKLFIAIENQFGMKYWAGANEDHLGKVFVGLEGYSNVENVRTYGKNELEQIIRSAGFNSLDFYYPYPDYKFPDIIFSDDFLPSEADLYPVTPVFDSERMELFNEKKVFSGIIKNGMFPFFANSFLVECGV
jgi:SAM-dependent methyltransferase